MLLYLLKAL